MRQTNKLIAVIVALAFVVGCAGMQLGQSQDEIYYKALGVWYDAGVQFKFYYEKADEATKEKWDDEFRPLLIKSKEILNVWNFHLQNDDPTADDIQRWKQMKNELLFYIATQMKKENS